MPSYTTRVLTTPDEIRAIAESWEALRQRQPCPALKHHPAWLALEARLQAGTQMAAVAVFSGKDLVGVVPFLVRPWTWTCRFAYATVARFPMRLATLCGETLLAPDDPAAHEAILNAVAEGGLAYDMIYLEAVPTNSRLWQALRESPAMRNGLSLYIPKAPEPHWFLRLPATFEAYLSQFSGKTRQTLQYKVRRLEKRAAAPVRLERVTAPEQVPGFLAHVAEVSSLSWQGRRLQKLVSASEATRAYFSGLAERGWLRSYLLLRGSQCLAFVVGFQADGVYVYEEPGYDPAWAALSPGAVTLYRLLEDLHAHDRPQWLDFGSGDAEYKQLFGTESVESATVYLLRRTPYVGLARTVHRSLAAVEDAMRRAVNASGARRAVVRFLRRGRDG